MKRRVLAVITVAALAISLTACGGGASTDATTNNVATTATAEPTQAVEEGIMTFECEMGKIVVKSCEIYTDHFENKCVRFYCTATNNSDKPLTPFRNPTQESIAWTDCIQGKKSLEPEWSETIDADKMYVDAITFEPGTTTECTLLFKLKDTEKDITLELNQFGKPDKVSHTFKMSEIPVV